MSGKTPIEIYEYDEKGQYIRKFNSMSDCRREYFSHIQGKIPILRFEKLGTIFGLTPSGNYLFNFRPGRKIIKNIHKVHTSEFCTDYITNDNKIIQVFNLEGKLLLEARNLNIIEKLTKIPRETARHQLKNNKGYAKEEFVIKYKEE